MAFAGHHYFLSRIDTFEYMLVAVGARVEPPLSDLFISEKTPQFSATHGLIPYSLSDRELGQGKLLLFALACKIS